MTLPEFSNEFDVGYNNIMSNAAPGLNEYEKSVFLTEAEYEILKNYFNPQGNKYGEGFDDSAKRQIDFSELVVTAAGTPVITPPLSFDKRAKMYALPLDILLILNENIETSLGITKQIIPIKFDEYTRLMSKPYKEPLKFQAWRLVSKGDSNTEIISEIIPKSTDIISTYLIRYVKRPKPIILTDLTGDYGDLTIDGISVATECELNPILHREILNRAVTLAKKAYQGDLQSTVELNERSE